MNQIIDIIINIIYKGLEYYGRYYSKYRAIVVDRDDPKGQCRLKLKVPGIIDGVSEWVPGSGIYSGKGYGIHVIPKENDVVWVTFENGDPTKPVWEYGYFGDGDIKSDNYKNVDNYWFITPGGHRVELNDSNSQIIITNKAGDQVVMNETGVSIKSSKIFLGSIDKGDEPAVLGDTLQKVLASMMSQMGMLSAAASALGSGLSNSMAAMSNTPPNPHIGGLLASMNSASITARKNAAEFTSQANNFNKNLESIANQLPSFKSKTVKLDK